MQQLFLGLQSGPHRLHEGRVLGCLLHACSITGASQGRYIRELLDATHAVRLKGKMGQQIILASPFFKGVERPVQDDKDINIPVREGSRSGSGSSADLKAKLLGAQGSSDRYAEAAVPARSLKHRCLLVLVLVPCLSTERELHWLPQMARCH